MSGKWGGEESERRAGTKVGEGENDSPRQRSRYGSVRLVKAVVE